MRPTRYALPLLLMLGACDGEPAQMEQAAPDSASAPGPAAEPADAWETQDGTRRPGARAPITRIPTVMQGRWGLTRADCEPGRADAKGLLTIDGQTLEFYESVGTLAEVVESGPNRLRAEFAFTGEGMTWEREIALDLQDEGRTLIRREYGEDAAPDPLRYTNCRGRSVT